jgi:zona occludens toxin (predicted ATPase)
MITVYTGTPGSGKTLASIRAMHKHKGHTITNINTTLPCVSVLPDEFSPADIIDLCVVRGDIPDSRFEGYNLLVIDEAQLYFNCRDYSKPDRRDWLSFFTHHRKLGLNVILVTQSLSYLDKQIRAICEYEYSFRRLSRWGFLGYVLYFLTFGEKYLYIDYYIPANQRLGTHLTYMPKRLFGYYDTYDLSGTALSYLSSVPSGERVQAPAPEDLDGGTNDFKGAIFDPENCSPLNCNHI